MPDSTLTDAPASYIDLLKLAAQYEWLATLATTQSITECLLETAATYRDKANALTNS